MAIWRPSFESLARKTSPIPPAPIGARISYRPTLSPAENGIGGVCQVYLTKCGVCRDAWPAGRLFQNDDFGLSGIRSTLRRKDVVKLVSTRVGARNPAVTALPTASSNLVLLRFAMSINKDLGCQSPAAGSRGGRQLPCIWPFNLVLFCAVLLSGCHAHTPPRDPAVEFTKVPPAAQGGRE